MSRRHVRRRLCRTALLLLLVAGLAATSGTAGCGGARRRTDTPRIVAAQLGLDGVVRPGRWATALVEIAHPGPGTFEGTVEVVTEGIERGAFSAAVHLPAGARQRVTLPFLCPPTGVAIELRAASGQLIDAPEVRVQPVTDEELVVAVLGPVPAGLRRLAAQKTARPRVVVAAVSPALAPALALGYEPADLVVWPEPSPGALDEPARTAALDHLRGGGRWLVTLGPGAPELERSAWQPLLPARIVEVEDVVLDAAAGEPLALTPAGGDARAARMHLASLAPRPGASVLAHTGDRAARPLLVHGTAGLGELTLLAVSASLPGRAESAAAGTPATAPGQVWRALVGARGASGSTSPAASSGATFREVPFASRSLAASRSVLGASHGTLTTALEKDLQVPPLSLVEVLVALVVYLLVIGPVDYLVLRRLGRLEWTWVTYPVAVLVFAVGVTLWGQSSRGSLARVARVDLVELLEPAGRYRARSYLALYTPSKGERRLGPGQGRSEALVAPSGIAGRRTSGARLLRAVVDGTERQTRLATHAAAISFLEARWTGVLGGSAQASGRAALRLSRQEGELVVESRLPFPLDEAWLQLPDGRTLRLGALPAGGTARVSPSAAVAGGDALQLATLTLGAGHALPARPGLAGGHVLVGRRASVDDALILDGQTTGTRGQLVLRAALELDDSHLPEAETR